MAAKLPKGESPKRTSGYADYLKGRRPNISKSEAAAQAGAVRKAGYDTSAFKKATAKPVAKKAAAKPSTVQQVAKRFGITAREARDIATAVSTAARTVTDANVSGRAGGGGGTNRTTKNGKAVGGRETVGETRGRAVRNIAKQVGEVYTAATKGKSGTQSAQIKSVKSRSGSTVAENYALETKRKQGSKK